MDEGMSSQDLTALTTAMRHAVIHDGPWLLRRPGIRWWALLVSPSTGMAILNIPSALTYLALRQPQLLRTNASISYARFCALLALELPIIGEQGKRLHTVTTQRGSENDTHPACCLLRTTALPWLHKDALPSVDEGSDVHAGAWVVPDLTHHNLLLELGVPTWPPPDLGHAPYVNGSEFYRSLLLPSLVTVPSEQRQHTYTALLLRYRSAERTRCSLFGYDIPDWLKTDACIDADVQRLLHNQ